MQTLVNANGKTYLVDLPAKAIRGIGNPAALISIGAFLLQNGSSIAKILSLAFRSPETIRNLEGKKLKVLGNTFRFTLGSSNETYKDKATNGQTIATATGEVYKGWDGFVYVGAKSLVKLTNNAQYDSYLQDRPIGTEFWVRDADVQIEVTQVATTAFPLQFGKKSGWVAWLDNKLIEKGYWKGSDSRPWKAGSDGYLPAVTWNNDTELSRIDAGLPASFVNKEQLEALVNALPKKGGGTTPIDPNPDPNPEPTPEKTGINPMWYAVSFLGAAKFGLLGKKLQKALKFG